MLFILGHLDINPTHLNLKFKSRKTLISNGAGTQVVTTHFQLLNHLLYPTSPPPFVVSPFLKISEAIWIVISVIIPTIFQAVFFPPHIEKNSD